MKLFQIGFIALTFGSMAVGCDSVDNAIDCSQVCSAYADCFDSDYDVDACTDSCEADAKDDDSYENKLEACEACIEDLSCGEATFECGGDCINIVP